MLRGGDAWKNRGSVLNQCSVLLRHPLVFHERERVTNNTNYEAGMGAQVYTQGCKPICKDGCSGQGWHARRVLNAAVDHLEKWFLDLIRSSPCQGPPVDSVLRWVYIVPDFKRNDAARGEAPGMANHAFFHVSALKWNRSVPDKSGFPVAAE